MPSLKGYKEQFIGKVLEVLWRQWAALGVSGHDTWKGNEVLDPEALLLLTTSFGRYDQRLFDEAMDWAVKNDRFVSTGRLFSMAEKTGLGDRNVLSAFADVVGKKNSTPKWNKLSLIPLEPGEITPSKLFRFLNDSQIPVVGESDPGFILRGLERNPVQLRAQSAFFEPKASYSLILTLRALFGVTSRCESLAYLITHETASIQEIADAGFYSWRSIQDVLFEMGLGAAVIFPQGKKGRRYQLADRTIHQLVLHRDVSSVCWVGWPHLFRGWEQILEFLGQEEIETFSIPGQVAALKDLIDTKIIPAVAQSELHRLVPNLNGTPEGSYITEALAFLDSTVMN